MANLQGRRVRATSAGIFGLGFKDKMKSVAAAGATLALATTGTVVVQSQLTPAVALANSLQEQDAIESPGPHNGRHTVNGHVYLDQEGTNSSKDATDVGLQGVMVYAQWMDERIKGYAISPIYSTTTRVDGSYSVSLPTWTDEVGIDHEFKANAYQKLRVWIDNPDPQRFQVSFMESDGVFGDSIQRYRSTWGIATRRVNEQNIALTERKQDWLAKPESEWAESGAKAAGGYITGRVFWDQRNAVGAGDVPQFAKGHGDIGVAGQKVAASYLNDDVSWQIHDWKISRNFNFTPQEMQQAQKDIIAKWEAENPGKSAIAETVYSYTDQDGGFTIQFNGTYGNRHSTAGLHLGQPGGGIANDKELLGTVAKSPSEGNWTRGNGTSKHVNLDYVFMYPVLDNPESLNVNPDNFRTAFFGYPAWNANYASAGGNDINATNNSDFALKPANPGFNVVDYNTTTNPAGKGDVVQTKTVGLVPNAPYVIKWYDGKGNATGT